MYVEMLAKLMIKSKAPQVAKEVGLVVDDSTVNEVYEMITDVHTLSEDMTVSEVEVHVNTALEVWKSVKEG